MKQKDIVTIAVCCFISAVVSIMIAKYTFGAPHNLQQQVEVVPTITSDFPAPDKQYFNSDSIDPTQLIQIGSNTNPAPFNSTQ